MSAAAKVVRPCSTCAYRGWNPIRALFDLHGCYRPNRPIDPVSGKPESSFCSNQRMFEHCCGPSGRFHSDNEAKP